jgi:hypothetical protein
MKDGIVGGGGVVPRPNATRSWRGQTNIVGLEMERKKEYSHNLSLHSRSDNKRYVGK